MAEWDLTMFTATDPVTLLSAADSMAQTPPHDVICSFYQVFVNKPDLIETLLKLFWAIHSYQEFLWASFVFSSNRNYSELNGL